jgi:hypothetical protein
MKDHQRFEDWLPLFVSGQLSGEALREMKDHLKKCPECRTDLEIWENTSHLIDQSNQNLRIPQISVQQVLSNTHGHLTPRMLIRRTYDLLKFQAPLVRQDLWPASAILMFIGMIVSIISNRYSLLYFLAPLVASATLAAIYGPENDDASELTYATATSPWKILLARLTLVSVYNLCLGLAATLGISLFLKIGVYWPLVFSWLAPMTFLSLLALFLSLWIGTGKAIVTAYSIWLLQYIPFSVSNLWQQYPQIMQASTWIRHFWQSSNLLFALSAFLLLGAFLSIQRMPLKFSMN